MPQWSMLLLIFLMLLATPSPCCAGDENTSVLKKGQKLDVVLKTLEDSSVTFEERRLAVRFEKGKAGRIYYIERPGHPDKPLKMVALKEKEAADSEYVVTSLSIHESFREDGVPKAFRKNKYTPVDEVKIDSLRLQPRPNRPRP